MPDERIQPSPPHPDHWATNLNPDYLAGVNTARGGEHPEADAPTAYDIKEAHERLQGFTDDELKQIPILPVGSRLRQGATYINLRDPNPTELKAMANMEAGPDDWYVPKDLVDYMLWNRLIGVRDPERLGIGDAR